MEFLRSGSAARDARHEALRGAAAGAIGGPREGRLARGSRPRSPVGFGAPAGDGEEGWSGRPWGGSRREEIQGQLLGGLRGGPLRTIGPDIQGLLRQAKPS